MVWKLYLRTAVCLDIKGKGEEKMIFNVPMHITYIRNGLTSLPADNLNLPMELRIVKTQTRRIKRGYYQVESERKKPHKIGYAVQRKRGVKAETDIRTVFDRIWEEDCLEDFDQEKSSLVEYIAEHIHISPKDARAEGGYTPKEYEVLFLKLNPKWDGWSRWAFMFHAIRIGKG